MHLLLDSILFLLSIYVYAYTEPKDKCGFYVRSLIYPYLFWFSKTKVGLWKIFISSLVLQKERLAFFISRFVPCSLETFFVGFYWNLYTCGILFVTSFLVDYYCFSKQKQTFQLSYCLKVLLITLFHQYTLFCNLLFLILHDDLGWFPKRGENCGSVLISEVLWLGFSIYGSYMSLFSFIGWFNMHKSKA